MVSGRRCDRARRETLDQRVPVTHHGVVVPPSVLDRVLDIDKVSLQALKVLAGFQIRVSLSHGEEPADGGRKTLLARACSAIDAGCTAWPLARATLSSVPDS